MSKTNRADGPARRWPVARVARCCAWGTLLAATAWIGSVEAQVPAAPAGVTVQTGIVYRRTAAGDVRVDVYRPAGRDEPAPAILAIHGGGWAGGSRLDVARMAARLAQHGYVVVAPDYTLSRPRHPSWPVALDDLRAALRWLRTHAEDYGIDPRRVAAFGTSAGGHLAALLATTAGHDDALKVDAVVDFYGPSDLRLLAAQNPDLSRAAAQFLGRNPATSHDVVVDGASPAWQATAAAPPALLVHGADDRRVPPAQSERLAAALRARRVRCRLLLVPGARHGFEFRVGDQRDLLPEIVDFLDSVWNGNSGSESYRII